MRLLTLAAAFVVAAPLVACTARIDTQGYISGEDLVAPVRIGVDGPNESSCCGGSPPSSRIFSIDQRSTWTYVMRRTKTESFFDEELFR